MITVLAGIIQGPVGLLATWSFQHGVENSTLRDVAIIVTWIMVIAGSVAIAIHLIPSAKAAHVAAVAPPPASPLIAEPSVGPVATSPSVAQPEIRIVVDVTPEYLVDLFKGHTSIQAKKLTEAYIGKWMKVSGPLGDVSNAYGYFVQVTFEHNSARKFSIAYFVTFMYFRSEWIERLAVLRRGSPITVLGQIKEVEAVALHLHNCELV